MQFLYGFDYHRAMAKELLAEILELTVPERIQLVHDIWDSIGNRSGIGRKIRQATIPLRGRFTACPPER